MADKKIIAIEIKVSERNAAKTINTTKQAVDGLAASTERLARANNKNKTNAGLNNAIIAEGARLASDFNYGYTAVANNLGQLISLFSASAKAAGGLTSAITALFSIQSLFLIGIQLLIAYGKDVYEFFVGSANAIEKETEALIKNTKELEKNIQKRELYQSSLLDQTRALAEDLRSSFYENIQDFENQELALEELSKRMADAGIENAKIIADENIAIDARLLIAEKLLLIYDEQTKQSELRNKVDKAELEIQGARIKLQNAKNSQLEIEAETVEKAISGQRNIISQQKKIASELNGQIISSRGNVKKLEEDIAVLQKRGVVLKPDDSEAKRRDFVSAQLNFDREIIQSQGRVTQSLVKNNEIRIKEEFDSLMELARIRQNQFKESQQRRVDAISNEQDRAKAQAAINIEIANSEESLNNYIIQLTEERNRKINQLNLDQLDKATELLEKEMGLRAEALLDFEMSMATNDFDRFEIQRDLEDAKTQNILNNLNRVRAAALLAGEETIGIDEKIAKTKEQLSYKQMQIDEAEAQAKLAVANQVAQAIIAIAGEQSAVGKAVAVAMATINTYEAVTAALGAKPYGAWNIAQAAATAAMGFVQVRKILQTEVPGDKGKGQATNVQAPDFNIVGASPESQLAQTVASQQQKPLKAFVVGKEITNHQELERNILTTAGLGN